MISFREYLIEETTDNKAHFTSFENLLKILKDGKLRGSLYDVSKNQLEGKDDLIFPVKFELCFARKNSTKNIHHGPVQYPEVKIILDWDNVYKLRGIKKSYPINEPYFVRTGFIKKQLDALQKKGHLNSQQKDEALDFLLNIQIPENYMELRHNEKFPEIPEWKAFLLSAVKKIKKIFGVPMEEKLAYGYVFSKLISTAIRQKAYNKYRREGEERLDLSRNSIPISSRYVKIFLDMKRYEDYGVDIEGLPEEIKKYSKRFPHLFEFTDLSNPWQNYKSV